MNFRNLFFFRRTDRSVGCRSVSTAIRLAVVCVACLNSARSDAQQSVLPFAGTDVVAVTDEDGLTEHIGGTIQAIFGDRLTIRRSGNGSILVLRLGDVTELSFQKGELWQRAVKQKQMGQTREALQLFDEALKVEQREWAWCELQAEAATTALQQGDRRQAVERIATIMAKDSQSRHTALLPLVWDVRLPENRRLQANPDDLGASSVVKRLAAASALLHHKEYRGAATAVLERIKKDEGISRTGELATAQLWRLHVLERPHERNPVLQVWADQVRDMPADVRAGPQYVVAQLWRLHHDYDQAALAFLWLPLMDPLDSALAAQSLQQAIECLKLAGRTSEATQLQRELHIRFPNEQPVVSPESNLPEPE